MIEPEFELNEEGEISKITINSSGSGWDESLKRINEDAKKWCEDQIRKAQCNAIKKIIERGQND